MGLGTAEEIAAYGPYSGVGPGLDALADGEVADAHNDDVHRLYAAVEQARVEQLLALVDIAQARSYLRDGATNLTAWLRTRAGAPRTEATRMVKLVGLLRLLPDMIEALRGGDVTIAHVEALARVATRPRTAALEEFREQLVAHATSLTADDYQALCQHWADLADEHTAAPRGRHGAYLDITPTLFGEADVRGHLSADQSHIVSTALNALNGPDPADAPHKRTARQRNADALTDLAHHFLNQPPTTKTPSPATPSSTRRAKPTGVVTIDLDTFTEGGRRIDLGRGEQIDLGSIRRDLLGHGPIPRRTAELVLCDADIVRLVLDPSGQPLNSGRATPTVTPAQRRAITVRDSGCVFPACDRPAHWCDAHHLHHRARGGPTDIDNLVLLCRHHHRLIHHDWDLERHRATGRVRAKRGDGLYFEADTDGVIWTYRDPPQHNEATGVPWPDPGWPVITGDREPTSP